MIDFSIVAAIDAERGIGKAGRLPWHLPGDLKHFKAVTCATESAHQQNAVIMGRKTWQSIPERFRPLPGRINLVLSRQIGLHLPEGVVSADSLQGALNLLGTAPLKDKLHRIFVIGGEAVFKRALQSDRCQALYVTHIESSFDCDTFFPPFELQFKRIAASDVREEHRVRYFFSEYIRERNTADPAEASSTDRPYY
ncbi:MAG: dihydrofolate reductase [Nitrospiria bacterium]